MLRDRIDLNEVSDTERLLAEPCRLVKEILIARRRYYEQLSQEDGVNDPLLFTKLAHDSAVAQQRLSGFKMLVGVVESALSDRKAVKKTIKAKNILVCERELARILERYSALIEGNKLVSPHALASMERSLAQTLKSLLVYCHSSDFRFALADICASAVMHADTLRESGQTAFRSP